MVPRFSWRPRSTHKQKKPSGDSRAAYAAQGFQMGEYNTMIDDDFQNIFRKMIEQFFGTEVGVPMGTEEFGFRMRPMNDEENTLQMERAREIEKVELDDEVLLLIDNVNDTKEPVVTVKGSEVTIERLDESDMDITTTIEFQADPDASFMHLTNGVLEITLKKLDNSSKSANNTWNVKIQ